MWHHTAAGQVQWAEQLMWVNKQAIIGCFSLYFIKQMCHDASLNASHLKRITASCIIIKTHDVTSSYNIVMSLVSSLTAHVWQVTWPIGIKGGCTWYGGFTQVLPHKPFKQLDHSKHAQVATHLVHPHDWSLLPSTVFNVSS